MATWTWELKRFADDRYSVRHQREDGVWETPSNGGWKGRDGAMHALFSSGATETTAKEMLRLSAPGKLVRLQNGGEIQVLNA